MESGDEDDAFTMGERDWQKMNRDLSKQGFRDGKNEGREKGMQQAFESATSLSLKYSMKLGHLHGLIEYQLSQTGATDADRRRKLLSLQEKIQKFLGAFVDSKRNFVNDKTTFELELNNKVQELCNECMNIYPFEYSSMIEAVRSS